jgi:hypothetical protein
MKNVVILSAAIASLDADMYLHYFRGSNNRLNEQSANRNNGNRLFDSQNNNRGGYNCCDLDPEDGFDANDWIADFNEMYDWRFLYDDDTLTKQYEEVYFVESDVSLTWTNQHGTGNKKLLSQMILQFGCDTLPRSMQAGADSAQGGPEAAGLTAKQAEMRKHGLRMELWNGGNTNTPDDPDAITGNNGIADTYSDNNAANEGRHESEEWYYLCEQRARQDGLFHADQDPQGNAQKYTRQNPGGTRRGLECPEERDYYPWWNPSPWHDIAIITPEMDYCTNIQAPQSQNVMAKCTCAKPGVTQNTGNAVEDWFPEDEYVDKNLDETECTAAGGDWSCFKWDGVQPECVDSYWTKVNYLGNADDTVRGGKQAHYDWRLPTWDSLTNDHFCYPYSETISYPSNGADAAPNANQARTTNAECVRMVFRIRYNMSTMDYDPYKTNSTHDYEPNQGILSPIEENPEVDVGFYVQGLQLAINTAQTGRTFQDRSHTFLVCKRDASGEWVNKPLLNVNVRGKRGNIVQTFPATEYDFEPQHVELLPTAPQCLHFQWCGSNTHNNGNPGGDGQTGDDGQGRGGSDRSNLVQMLNMDESYPVAYDTLADEDNFFEYVNCYHPFRPDVTVSSADAQLILGTAGFYKGVEYMQDACAQNTGDANGENRGDCIVDELLNNVSGSFRAGLICCLKDNLSNEEGYEKIFSFLSTRNNNFSNRAQKWQVKLTSQPDATDKW